MQIIDVVECIFGIARGEIDKMISLLKYTGLDTNKIDFIKKLIDEIANLGVFGKTSVTDLVIQKTNNRNEDEFAIISKKI